MPCSLNYFIIYAVVFISCFQFSTAGNNHTDRAALLEIKKKINDPLAALSSWNDSFHFCSWYGVSCSRMHQRVTELDLQSMKLSGSLSPCIGNLSFLTDLNLENNTFGGMLPPEIGHLHRLQILWINNNSITGVIPSNISGCYGLSELDASNNKLVGGIPDELGSLPNLQLLSLRGNNLTGNIPSSLGNLSSLSLLEIERNNVVGSIPNSFGRLTKLITLAMSENKLSGLVPSTIFNLSRLTAISLGYNDLKGSLPSDIGLTLPKLYFLSIINNSFDGVIPPSVSNLSNLQFLQLGLNHLRGDVPSLKNLVHLQALLIDSNFLGNGRDDDLAFVSSLENATMLSYFGISQNNLHGNFPRIICNFSMLTYLNLEMTKITGEIPICINHLSNLRMLSTVGTSISGVIPQSIGKLQKLEELYLTDNQLSGYIPSSIGNLTKLTKLTLNGNNLVGQIPLSIGNCSNLLLMDLSHNNLNGIIPPEILSLSTLSIWLFLNNNHFIGPLHTEVGQLRNLLELDISRNMLSGEIPSSLGACVELELLDMSGNLFEGTIPDALKTLMSLRVLNLSRNNLSGKIPNILVDLPLKILNLSYNNFMAEVPVGGIFGNDTGISVVGNYLLCGGIPALKLPKCPSNSKHIKRSGRRNKLLLALIFGFLGVIMLAAFASLGTYWYRKRSRKTANATDSNNSLLNLSYQNLLKATNGFSSENLIGGGSFGIVYKGILDPDETLVAIKVFKLEHHGASKSFMAECGILRNIRHRNLVKVITACSSIDYQGNDFKALVYEYMVNGNLEEWLYPNIADQHLNFRQRLDIAVDVAYAMDYLHHGYGASIVHCDLKPSNILLDRDMVAHVGDFGLAKFLATSQAFQSSSLGVRGTVGYAPPEYGVGNEVSTSGDVYSFGILLMEMFIGKRPTLETFKDGLSMHNLVQAALPENVSEILDGSLLDDECNEDNEDSRGMRMILDTSISILGIALSCSSELPLERMGMKEVGSELSAIRNKFIGTRN